MEWPVTSHGMDIREGQLVDSHLTASIGSLDPTGSLGVIIIPLTGMKRVIYIIIDKHEYILIDNMWTKEG
jgi:hypothetical protein